ncbi:MAG TPA: right-handed parallel beta-helix repeat-containing protein [Planctomycetota bacterium]
MLVLLWIVLASCLLAQAESPASAAPLVTVRQQGPADFVGADHATLAAALANLGERGGGTLLVGPGRYVVRRSLFPPANVTIRGEAGSVLALPSPGVLRVAAAAGTRELLLREAGEFATDGRIGIFPPAGVEFLPDGESIGLGPLALASVQGERLELVEPLTLDVPAGSRVSYPVKLVFVNRAGGLTLENLTFAGGRIEDVPMPGHFVHCAIWASPPFGFGSEPAGPPAREVTIRHCRFTDWYGRAIAFYNVADSLVEGSLFERIADEAIDLDHYCERVRVVGNLVRESIWGIVLNDASRCTVEYNFIEGCEVGIYGWWLERVPPEGLNEENRIQHNTVRASRQASILLERGCHRNVIEHNFVDRAVRVVESTNTVRDNTLW